MSDQLAKEGVELAVEDEGEGVGMVMTEGACGRAEKG